MTTHVLILCTHNSARSVLSEGMLNHLATRLGQDVQAHSAGSAPSGRINPFAIQAAFDGVREEAAAGTRTTLDVLDAEQELLDARNARLEAEAQRYVAVYQVLATMGLLTVEHLQLGILTYDPEAYYGAVEKAPSHSAQGKKLDRILERSQLTAGPALVAPAPRLARLS